MERDMEKETKRVHIVGKGHSTCFTRVLEEWYYKEIFADVVLTSHEHIDDNDSSRRDTCRQIHANKSVLAAASPTLARIFSQCSPDDETHLVFTGYSYRTLHCVIEFIYTGIIGIQKHEKTQVEQLMQELCLKVPSVTEVQSPISSLIPLQLVITASEDSAINQPVLLLDDPLALSPSTSLDTAGSVELVQPATVFKRKNKKVTNQPGRKFAKPIQKPSSDQFAKTETPSGRFKQFNPGSSIYNQYGDLQDPVDLEFVISAPVNQRDGTERQKSVVIRMLNRKIDEEPASEKYTCPDPLQTEYTCLGLTKSFAEKTLTVAGNALVPPINVQQNGVQRKAFNTLQEAMRTSYFREIVNALSETPGLYSIYRERLFPVSDIYYEPSVNWAGNNLFIKSYLDKNVKRTYLGKPKGSVTNQSELSFLDLASCLNGKTIESLHEAKGKVHIQFAGDPLVNQSSVGLFEDNPHFDLTPDEIITRLSFEHNYSTGEAEQAAVIETQKTVCEEQTDDLNIFKRSVQLSINEQRRNNRLRQKIQILSKKVTLMKRKALELLASCRDVQDMDTISSSMYRPKKRTLPAGPKLETKVSCGICNKSVKRTWLKRHLIIAHSNERNHLCDECGRTFALKGQLTSHQVRQHKTKPGNHICDQCGRSFRFLRYLNRHMSLHSNLKPHSCPFCDKSFRLKTVLTKHIRTHTGERPYHCSVCGRSFRQRTTYARHLKMHEKFQESGSGEMDGASSGSLPRLKCEFCSMTFRLDLFRMLHRAKHTGETPCLPCPTCSITFPSIKELSSHRKTEHPETVYACHLCPKIFTNKPNFDFHILKHTDPNAIKKKYPLKPIAESGPCVCEFCDKVFKSRVSLDYHIKGIHLNGRTFRCEFCDKTSTSKAAHEQHRRTHDGELLYKCELCPSAFREQLLLDAHLMAHTDEAMFICPHCDKEFTNQTALYAHIRIHTGDRLECSFCQKILPSVDQLAIHEEACSMNVGQMSAV